jgi:predicted phage tail protein
MLRKVKLYGELADFVGHKELDAVINSTAEAIRFLVTNFPKLEAHMSDKHYRVLIDDYDIDKNEIHNPIGQSDISIVPVITGAGGVGRALAGVALIGLAFATGGAGLSLGLSGFTGGAGISAVVGNIGIGLTLMGVSEMLFPLPKPQDFSNEEDPRISFSFSGIQNTSRAGTSHPIVYGEIITGSVVISAGIDTNQVTA